MIAYLALNAAVSAACFLALWGVSLRLKDVSFIDSWWALGLGLLALLGYLEADTHGPRNMLLFAVCALWSLRLGLYLLWRWRRNGADPRYARLLAGIQAKRGWSVATTTLVYVFALQGVLQFVVSLPVQIGQSAPPEIGPLSEMGLGLAVLGLLFESIGDWQLVRFKSDSANKGKVLESGLWRYTRHPNYFGDVCVWWGLFLIASESGAVLWILPAPVLLTFLLTSWSGVPTVEGRMGKRPEYQAYVARTPGFVPWFPKK